MVWADLACTALVEVGVKRYIYIDRYIPRVNVNTTLDSRDVRPLSYVVLAVAPAVTMDEAFSLLLSVHTWIAIAMDIDGVGGPCLHSTGEGGC